MPDQTMPDHTIIEGPVMFTGTGQLHLGAGFDDPHLRHLFTGHETTRCSRNLRLPHVVVDPQTALVFSDGAVVEVSRFMPRPNEQRAAEGRLALGGSRKLGGRVFMGYNRVGLNHFHWLTQCVPAIAGYQGDPGFATGTVLLPPLDAGHYRALALAGIALPATHVADEPPPIAVDDMTYSTLLADGPLPSLFCRSVFARMAAHADGVAPGPPTRSIYVWRVDTPARTMRNEDALVELLLGYGIEPMILTTLNLDEQIALFRSARLVVGGHGAGLANVVFCQPGATIYELLPSHWVKPSMNVLAQLASLNYWADIHAAESRADIWRHQTPWSVDLDAVERRLATILETM